MKSRRIVIDRCSECAACQEYIVMPESAPACSRLQVRFPGERHARGFGTERKAYRAIEQWAEKHIRRGENSINYVEVLWRQGTTVKPILRKPFNPKRRAPTITEFKRFNSAITDALTPFRPGVHSWGWSTDGIHVYAERARDLKGVPPQLCGFHVHKHTTGIGGIRPA